MENFRVLSGREVRNYKIDLKPLKSNGTTESYILISTQQTCTASTDVESSGDKK